MRACMLCPRQCGVNRADRLGYCAQSDSIRVARAAAHMWEEPCISGKNGSGTVFFCGCTLKCVYCQNAEISQGSDSEKGVELTPSELAGIFIKLQKSGVHNINLVTPTMFAPQISKAIDSAKKMGLTLPIIYNTSGYELCHALSVIADNIDIYLPDFKYLSPEIAAKYSGASDYPTHAKASLDMMVKRIGEAEFSEDGMMKRGVIVRHLLLPGQLKESIRILDYLFFEYGNGIYYSIMSQYTPLSTLDSARYPELCRRVTTYEYQKLIDHAATLDIRNGFVQEGASATESFIPSFNGEGVR